MPYKNEVRQKNAQREHYANNKVKYRDNLRKRRQERARWFYEYKLGLKCMNCPEKHPACLQFHHRDPSEKIADVAWMVDFAYSMERILEEIEKCDVLCANCHKKHHWNEMMDNGFLRINKTITV